MPAAAPARSSPTSRCSTRRSALAAHKPAQRAAGRPRPRADGAHAPAATSTTPRCASSTATRACPAPGSMPRTRATRSTPAAPPAKPKGVQRDTGGYAVALAASMKHIFLGNAGETYFSHQRHRLGRRPQLHRLRPADRRHGDDHVRGPADPARRRHLVEPGREVQGDGDVQRADRGARAEEAGPGVPEEVRPVDRCARCSSPASRSTSRPRNGSPTALGRPIIDNYWQTETGWPILTICQRHRAGAQQVRLARASRCTATTSSCVDENTGEELTACRTRRAWSSIEGPLPPGCMQTVWRDDERFVEHLLAERPGPAGLQHLRLGHPRRGRLLLHPRPHRRRHQRRRPPAGHARDRGEHLEPPERRRGGGGRRRRCAEGPGRDGVRRAEGRVEAPADATAR